MNPIVIIPTYNEKENISELINEISNNLVGYNFSILVVDDGSPDGTAETVENLNKANVFILKRDGKKGLASAYIDGIKYSIEKDSMRLLSMMPIFLTILSTCLK